MHGGRGRGGWFVRARACLLEGMGYAQQHQGQHFGGEASEPPACRAEAPIATATAARVDTAPWPKRMIPVRF